MKRMKKLKVFLTLDKIGSVGAVLAAAAAPCCFPLLAALGGALGLSVLHPFVSYMAYVMQALVLLSLAGNYFAWRRHKKWMPLAISGVGVALVFLGYYSNLSTGLVYVGLGMLVMAAMLNIAIDRSTGCCAAKPAGAVLKSILTCPHCGFQKEETMPTDSCQFFYECTNCHATLKPKKGDCCVFCSYGSVKCPPKQAAADCPGY
jgi:hypothetical protein